MIYKTNMKRKLIKIKLKINLESLVVSGVNNIHLREILSLR
jgi:hypothetical protein